MEHDYVEIPKQSTENRLKTYVWGIYVESEDGGFTYELKCIVAAYTKEQAYWIASDYAKYEHVGEDEPDWLAEDPIEVDSVDVLYWQGDY